MYKVIWDKGKNGVKLKYSLQTGFAGNPRPVFYEELDILGLNKYWNYPKSENPLLWAIERKYFYKGIEVATIRGGNIYDAPEIVLTEAGYNLKLEPIDIDSVIAANKEALFVLENEAMDFIEKTFKVYRPDIETLRNKKFDKIRKSANKIDFFTVSFSGGKDSQVVLDLVSRVIPPDCYKVIYADTGMELPSSIDTFHKTKQIYQKKYPKLKFYIEKNEVSTEDYWREFGPPSRFHRWCCTVIKTVPFNRLLWKLNNGKGNPRVLIFEGVRKEESAKRETYGRIGVGVKHTFNINARPVLSWNITEIWLYLFYRNLPLNKSYRNGLTRVGCSVCPFASSWSEFFISRTYPTFAKKYFSLIEKQVDQQGIKDKREYIKTGNWKKRSGGRGLINFEKSRVDFITQKPDFLASMTEPKENLLEWIKVVGDAVFDNSKSIGEIKIKNDYYKFEIKKENGKESFRIRNIEQNPILIGKIKKVLYKTTYCVHCEACQIECPTGALTVSPIVQVNTELCTHCSNCLTFADKGCLVASSKHVSEGGKKMHGKKTSGIDRYSTFGLREKWLKSFLENSENWFESNNQLGTKQVPAMINWLRDAELLEDKEKKPTKLCGVLVSKKSVDFVWQIILTNLYYNSTIMNWFFNNINWNKKIEKNDLVHLLENYFTDSSPRTLNNALQSLINTFEQANSAFMQSLVSIEKSGNKRTLFKSGTNTVDSHAILYSLYRYAEKTGRYSFTISDLYLEDVIGGPYKIFGISKSALEKKLRGLQESKNRLIDVAIVADLDTVNLRNDITAFESLNLIMD